MHATWEVEGAVVAAVEPCCWCARGQAAGQGLTDWSGSGAAALST